MGRILAKSPQSGDVFKISNFKAPVVEEEPVEPIPEWQRPSDWLEMPQLDKTKDEAYILFSVDEDSPNSSFISIGKKYGNQYNVYIDWGDGEITDFRAAVDTPTTIVTGSSTSTTRTFSHLYDYNSIPANTYTSHNNSRQIIAHVYCDRGVLNSLTLSGQNTYYDYWGNKTYYSNDSTNNLLELSGTAELCGVFCGSSSSLKCRKLESINWDGRISSISNYSFGSCPRLQHISDIYCNSAGLMMAFNGCHSLKKLPNIKIGEAEMNHFTNNQNLGSAFSGCYNITEIPYIFEGKITSLSQTFMNCYKLKKIPDLDTSNCNSMSSSFSSCRSLKEIKIDMSNSTSISNLFSGCSSLESVDLVDTSKVTNAQGAFSYCYRLKTIKGLTLENCINFSRMFSDCVSLEKMPSTMNTSKGENFSSMFTGCYSLKDVTGLDTSNGTDLSSMFSQCTQLKEIDVDTSKATKVSSLFSGFSGDYIPYINTSNCTEFTSLFYSIKNISKYPAIDTRKATSLAGLISSNESIKILPPLYTSNCNNLSFFTNVYSLEKVYPMDCSNVTSNIQGAFYSLKSPLILYNFGAASTSSLSLTGQNQIYLYTPQDVVDTLNALATNPGGKTRTFGIGSTLYNKLNNIYVKPTNEYEVYRMATGDLTRQAGKTYYIYNSDTDSFSEYTDELVGGNCYCEDITCPWTKYVICNSSDEGAILLTSWASTVKGWTIRS